MISGLLTIAILLAGCRADDPHLIASYGDLPPRPYSITYTVGDESPYTVTYDSGVAELDPNGTDRVRGNGRGYVVDLSGTGCPNPLAFSGTPAEFVDTDYTDDASVVRQRVIPLSHDRIHLDSSVAYKLPDEVGTPLYYLFGGSYRATQMGTEEWTVEIHPERSCPNSTDPCVMDPDPVIMHIEGEIFVVPDPVFLVVQDSVFFDNPNGPEPCDARVERRYYD